MTIYALSTGPGISGVAIIRISGEQSSKIIETLIMSPHYPNSCNFTNLPVVY